MSPNRKDSEWFSAPPAARKRKPFTITLSDVALERLEKMAKARKLSRSQVIDGLILGASIREPSVDIDPRGAEPLTSKLRAKSRRDEEA